MNKARLPIGLLLAATTVVTAGCNNKTGEARTVGPAEPARRAASSFVHCVEADGGGCVPRDPKQGSWDAFALLQWLGGGSPTAILQALRRELEHHRDPYAVQERFVVVTSRYREPLRGAECKPESATQFSELMPKLLTRVETRMEALGLWRAEPSGGRSSANRKSRCRRSRSVLLYSYAVNRRSTVRPPVDRFATAASRSLFVRASTTVCRSPRLGCFASAGGISLTLIRSSTSCHVSTSLPRIKSVSSESRRKSAFCLSGP